MVGPDNRMETMSTIGVGALTATRNRDGIDRSYGSFATYDIGKVIVAGGGSVTEDGKSSVPTKTAAVVDVNGSGTTVRSTDSMSVGRRQANLTVLADGSVLATGGQSSSVNGLVDLRQPGLRRGTVGSRHRDLDRARPAPAEYGSTTRRRPCCRTAAC